jgi:hypothetical protein
MFVLTRFMDDDFGYLQWLRDRPGTFVLDTERRPSRSFVVLHRASCPTIGGPTKTGGWTTRMLKVCATTFEELESWSQYEVGVNPTYCPQCKPSSTSPSATPSRAVGDKPKLGASPEQPAAESKAGETKAAAETGGVEAAATGTRAAGRRAATGTRDAAATATAAAPAKAPAASAGRSRTRTVAAAEHAEPEPAAPARGRATDAKKAKSRS